MRTVREYFDLDVGPTVLTMDTSWTIGTSEKQHTVLVKQHQDSGANARFLSFYFETDADERCMATALSTPEASLGVLSLAKPGPVVEFSNAFRPWEVTRSNDLRFTGRVFVYVNRHVEDDLVKRLELLGKSRRLWVTVRDQKYADSMAHSERPLAFISHDSRDKDGFVRNLALELFKRGCSIWYDEYSLNVGDSLREKIEKGLKEAKKCVVVLSPHFLSNRGWGRAEFDSVFTREILERSNVILPVWLNVTAKEVYEYSPSMADRVGIAADLGEAVVAARLSKILKA